MKERKDELSIFISLILRHKPEVINIKLDKYGYAKVNELIDRINKLDKHIDMQMLEKIVAEDDKQRYKFNDEHKLIRASQGHSFPVDLELIEKEQPELLYHGTAIGVALSLG